MIKICVLFLAFCAVARADGNAKWAFGNCDPENLAVDDTAYDIDFGECFSINDNTGTPVPGGAQLVDCEEEYIVLNHYETQNCSGEVYSNYRVNVTCADSTGDFTPHVRIDASKTDYMCEKEGVSGDISVVAIVLIATGVVALLGSVLYCIFCRPTGRVRR